MTSFDAWMAALEERHLADLTFAEVVRALRALSSAYVERRQRLDKGAALSGNGKRAAFALFYGPLHFLLVREIAAALAPAPRETRLADLGCGTGASGAGWAAATATDLVTGIDRHPWAIDEAAWTYRFFGLRARTVRGDVAGTAWPRERSVFLSAFALNELGQETRERVFRRLLERHRAGCQVLIVEPLARFVAPWWEECRREVVAAGGRADEWRLRVPLPEIVSRLDRAAGLDHRELTGRSLWLP